MTTVTLRTVELATGTSTTVTTVAGDIVIVGQVEDLTPTMPAQQSTVNYYNADNPSWTRAIMASDTAVTVVRNGSNSVAWATDLIVQASLLLEETLTWVTYAVNQPSNVSVETDAIAVFVAKFTTELGPLTFSWEESDNGTFLDAGGHRTVLSTSGIYKIANGGDGVTSVLCVTPSDTSKDGFYYRCVATDSAGTPNVVPSDAAVLTVTEPA